MVFYSNLLFAMVEQHTLAKTVRLILGPISSSISLNVDESNKPITSSIRPKCRLRLSECPGKPKLYFAWQKYFSFVKMLFNVPLRDFQISREPSLG